MATPLTHQRVVLLLRYIPQYYISSLSNQCFLLLRSSSTTSSSSSLQSPKPMEVPLRQDPLTTNRGTANNNNIAANQQLFSSNLSNTLRENVNWFNCQYERIFGIDEIRQMQNKVLEAEREFVDITRERKLCQDKIENFKEEIKNIRDKVDITPRQSDNYLKLITEEHKLLREQLAHDTRLDQLKDKEQWSLDNLSRLLRQSHELERLRQERAKYWQIISLGLSVAGGIVALFAQKVRNQNTTLRELNSMKQTIQSINETNDIRLREVLSQINVIKSLTSHIADKLQEQQTKVVYTNKPSDGQKASVSNSTWASWVSWISGYGYIKSKLNS